MAEMEKKGNVLMERYELGKLLGQGTFAKVYHARNLNTGKSVAVKVINKEKITKTGLIEQIKREISVMSLVKHPNVVQLHEVMATKKAIYLAMDYVRGGELFQKVSEGRLKEGPARKYFQQLIAAVDYCHSRGVYHRDIKPENLLLDQDGKLKVMDFGLSALVESKRQDGLLHATCGTPAYISPEVINGKGYSGEKADIWSCGVVLFVLLAGYLPFQHSNLMEMYRKISRGEFKCPNWFHPEVKKLLSRILNPNPSNRITFADLMENSWFKKGFKGIDHRDQTSLPNQEDEMINNTPPMRPNWMNAFDLISLSPGFDLSGMFQKDEDQKSEARFTTTKPTSIIVSRLEEIATTERFRVTKRDGRVKLQGRKEGRKGQLAIDAEIFEVAPSFHVVEVTKVAGDTLEYRRFCNQDLKPSLNDIVWTWQGCGQQKC